MTEEEIKPGMEMIKPTSFYSNNREKIKLNWFCYELSLSFYDKLSENLGKRLKKYKIAEKAIADFSISMVKEMKEIILQQLSGRIEDVYFSYKMVEPHFPYLSDKLVNKIVVLFEEAWVEQLNVCAVCPTRCISEKDVYCTMFDDKDIF